jgi:hypothetical protein
MIAESGRAGMGVDAQSARRRRPRPSVGYLGHFSRENHDMAPIAAMPWWIYTRPRLSRWSQGGGSGMRGMTTEQLGRAVGMSLALALLEDMQREKPGGRYPEGVVRARAAAALRDAQEAWAADGPPLPKESRTVALRTMMDLLEAVIDRW